ncbi:MAG: LIM domain-containing protein [Desulfosudaceae bacterium]
MTITAGIANAEERICGICGEPIVAGKYIRLSDGSTYHKTCLEQADRCAICSRPIGKDQETVALSGDRICHQACYEQADLCGICGQPIVSGKYIRLDSGQTYHKACYEQGLQCPVCSRPIGKGQKTVALAEGRVCHADCYAQADICDICGQPICSGQQHVVSGESGKTYHLACFDKVPKCGLTGAPITPGTDFVKIGYQTYLKTAYDKARKCLVTRLPVSNNGKYLVNARTKTYVLEKYRDKTRQCYSCGDHLVDGFALNNDLFLCRYCYENGIRDSRVAQPYIGRVMDFFREKEVAVPANVDIRILPPGQLIAEDQPDLKGRCRTHCSSKDKEPATLSFTVEILWGLNPDVFASVAAHELSHAVIGEALFDRMNCHKPKVPYEEGRCEYTAYTFARSRRLPEFIIAGFAENQVDNYREEFLYVKAHPPENIKTLLTALRF